MQLQTPVDIPHYDWSLSPCEGMLFVGSCFADNLGAKFTEEKFRTVVNPFGVMYNPVSIGHTVDRLLEDDALPFTAGSPCAAVFTLGTNHVYVLKETGEIVDNCRKRPQQLFREELLSVDACADSLCRTIDRLRLRYPQVNVLLTVSPIRYRKYGYHGSQLSKATLLLAVDKVVRHYRSETTTEALRGTSANASGEGQKYTGRVDYFPSYEIMNDELRDYRFYKPDMLHPSDQAVDYIWERLKASLFSQEALDFLSEWKPLKEALGHKPFHPEAEAYQKFMAETQRKIQLLKEKYPQMPV
jgi:hypothetical protein